MTLFVLATQILLIVFILFGYLGIDCVPDESLTAALIWLLNKIDRRPFKWFRASSDIWHFSKFSSREAVRKSSIRRATSMHNSNRFGHSDAA